MARPKPRRSRKSARVSRRSSITGRAASKSSTGEEISHSRGSPSWRMSRRISALDGFELNWVEFRVVPDVEVALPHALAQVHAAAGVAGGGVALQVVALAVLPVEPRPALLQLDHAVLHALAAD